MASSLLTKGLRPCQFFTRITHNFRTCLLLKNVTCKNTFSHIPSDRYCKARKPGWSALIGVLSAAGLKQTDNSASDLSGQQIKASVTQLIEEGKKNIRVSSVRKASDLARKGWRDGKLSDEEWLIAQILINNVLGYLEMITGDLVQAERTYKSTLQLYHQFSGDKFDDAALELVLRLTTVYALHGKSHEAMESLDMVIQTQMKKLKNSKTCPSSTYNVLWSALQMYGRFLVRSGQFDEAETMFQFCDEVLRKGFGENFGERQNILTDLASVQKLKKDFVGAEKTYDLAINVGVKGKAPSVCSTYCHMANLATEMSKFDKAEKMYEAGLKMAKKMDNKECLEQAELAWRKLDEARTEIGNVG